MDKEFWISIKENNFEFPAEHSLSSLTEELISYIGSTDSELRDTIGLEAFYHWLIQDRYSTDDLRGIIIRLTANLHENIGEKEGDGATREIRSMFFRTHEFSTLSPIASNQASISTTVSWTSRSCKARRSRRPVRPAAG